MIDLHTHSAISDGSDRTWSDPRARSARGLYRCRPHRPRNLGGLDEARRAADT